MFGVIKHFNNDRGFGFITPDAPGLQDQFFHVYAVQTQSQDYGKLLAVGTPVAFEIAAGPDGRNRAVKVNVIQTTMTDLHGNPAPVGKMSGFVD